MCSAAPSLELANLRSLGGPCTGEAALSQITDLANARAEPSASGPPPPWLRLFPGEASQLNLVRRWLRSLLPECPARDDVLVVTTELSTNALQHTASGLGNWFAVAITWDQETIRVAVADCGAPGTPHEVYEPRSESGRGLQVVNGLSVRCETSGDEKGRLVWAEVTWDGAPGPPESHHHCEVGDELAVLARRNGIRLGSSHN